MSQYEYSEVGAHEAINAWFAGRHVEYSMDWEQEWHHIEGHDPMRIWTARDRIYRIRRIPDHTETLPTPQ